jgi:LmbE family N-acetylglucosaminyl deacetylase
MVVMGAHPDDPESCCGGTMLHWAEAGHAVVSAYLTKGEAGIPGKSHAEAAEIRTREAEVACEVLHARPVFLNQIDGSSEITPNAYDEVHDFLNEEAPDIVLTHWPIDTHRDHRICSVLTYDAWLRGGRRFSLYYYEAMTGQQSQNFNPTDYVDIGSVVERKHQACAAHESQKVGEWYDESHGQMELFRGHEAGCKYAEAYVHHWQSKPYFHSF